MPAKKQTSQDAFPPVRVVSGPAFELIAQLAAFESGPARASLESGKTWIRRVRTLAGPDLIRRVDGWAFALYAELAAIALETGPPYSVEQLTNRVRSTPPDRLRRRLLGAESPPNRSMVSDGAFDRALAGDARAQSELRSELGVNPPARRSVERLLSISAEDVQADVVELLEEWASRVFPAFAEDSMELIRRDTASKEQALRETPPRDLLRVATNGVEFDVAEWATEIVLVPTVALRPFIGPVESESTAIILCSVADETLDDDPAAPPRRLVKIAVAIGDELRLRILRELGNGDLTATQLATRLGMDRTSLAHHLGILRSAGLVAVSAQGVQNWTYSLRWNEVEGAGAALIGYVGPRS